MDLTEELISSVTQQVCGSNQINYQGTEINLAPGWRLATAELVQEATGLDFNGFSSRAEAAAAMEARACRPRPGCSVGRLLTRPLSKPLKKP